MGEAAQSGRKRAARVGGGDHIPVSGNETIAIVGPEVPGMARCDRRFTKADGTRQSIPAAGFRRTLAVSRQPAARVVPRNRPPRGPCGRGPKRQSHGPENSDPKTHAGSSRTDVNGGAEHGTLLCSDHRGPQSSRQRRPGFAVRFRPTIWPISEAERSEFPARCNGGRSVRNRRERTASRRCNGGHVKQRVPQEIAMHWPRVA